MKSFILIFFLLLISCKDDKTSTKLIKDIEFSSELYSKVLEYQTKHPIPKPLKYDKSKPPPVETSFIYVYEAKFTKENNEIVLGITLYPIGINDYYDSNNIKVQINGIYKDYNLKPTYVNDPYRLGKDFVKQYLNNQDIQNFYYHRDIIMDAMYDINLYKLQEGKLIFYKVLKGNVH